MRKTITRSCHVGRTAQTSVEAVAEADVDSFGNVLLSDGSSVHGLKFDLVEFHRPWTDLDEAIVWLTIQAFQAEHIFLRRYVLTRPSESEPPFYRCVGIDYGILHTLREPNAKDLTRYINKHIGALPRENGKAPFKVGRDFALTEDTHYCGYRESSWP